MAMNELFANDFFFVSDYKLFQFRNDFIFLEDFSRRNYIFKIYFVYFYDCSKVFTVL